MRQPFRVELVDPDETYNVVADARDVRAWEAAYEQSYLDGQRLSLTRLAQLAHLACVRAGLFTGDYPSFDARCVAAEAPIELPGPDAELVADPTQPVPTDDSSSR